MEDDDIGVCEHCAGLCAADARFCSRGCGECESLDMVDEEAGECAGACSPPTPTLGDLDMSSEPTLAFLARVEAWHAWNDKYQPA